MKSKFSTRDAEGRLHIAPVVYIKNAFRQLPEGMVAYGGVEWTFWAMMAMTAFTSAYLTQQGTIPSSTIGVMVAIMNGIGIISAPIIGALSDKVGSSRRMLIICGIVSSVIYIFVPTVLHQSFHPVLMTTLTLALWAFFLKPMQALVENWAVVAANRKGTFTFGSVRYFGSIGYAIICFLGTVIATRMGSQEYSFYAFPILMIPLVVIAVLLKKDDAGSTVAAKKKGAKGSIKLALNSYYFKMFLVVHCLASLPLYCSMTFLPYKLEAIGGSINAFGSFNAVRALFEIPTLLFGSKLVRKFGIKSQFIFSIGLYLSVQMIVLFATAPWMLMIAMMVHGFAYGLYLLCEVNYIYRITPLEASASGQSLAVSLSLLSGVIGNLIGGVLIDKFGVNSYFLFSSSLEIVAIAIFAITYPIGRKIGRIEPDLANIV